MNQVNVCNGTAGGITPQESLNHWARCGHVNKFDFEGNNCEINQFSTTETPLPGTNVSFNSIIFCIFHF